MMNDRYERSRRIVILSIGALLVGGVCSSEAAAVRRHEPTRELGLKEAVAPTTSSNRAVAIKDAAALLKSVVPPAGAVLQSQGTGVGERAHLINLAVASAVSYSTWTVAQPAKRALTVVEADLPAGFRPSSTNSSSGGPVPPSHGVVLSRPSVPGVLGERLLELQVTSLPHHKTELYAEAQSQWIVARSATQKIPATVRSILITDRLPGQRPFLERDLTAPKKVARVVQRFNSLALLQPIFAVCPPALPGPPQHPTLTLTFLSRHDHPLATSTLVASNAPASACLPLTVSVRGGRRFALTGSVVPQLHTMLGVNLTTPPPSPTSPSQ